MKTKRPSEISDYKNRILPIYLLILRKLFLYYLLILPAFILLPTFFAVVVSVLIILEILYTKHKKANGMLTSPWSVWKKYGYKPYILSLIIATAILILLVVNIFIQPAVFRLSVNLFYALF